MSHQIIKHSPSECQGPFGMENGAISDGQISASSEWNAITHSANFGRLHCKLGSGAWVVLTNDVSQWIQIALGEQQMRVTRVATQGRYKFSQWVSKYSLQYSNDGVNFQYYKEQGQTTDKVSFISNIIPVERFVSTVQTQLNKIHII